MPQPVKFLIRNILWSSGLQHHVVPLVVTNFSEEPSFFVLNEEITAMRSHDPEKYNVHFNRHTDIRFRLGIVDLGRSLWSRGLRHGFACINTGSVG
jgi:hypothetical protein